MIVQYDSVTLEAIPANAQAVAGYVGGKYETYGEVVKKWPHAHHLSIAVNATEDAECLDVENGDATPGQAAEWFKHHARRAKPVFYASLSVVPELEAALKTGGFERDQYLVWSAHYTGIPHICGPSEGLPTAADATQWTDKALGRNLDESLCTDGFFAVAPAGPKVPADEARWIREYDALPKKNRTVYQNVRARALRRRMSKRRELIWRLANDVSPKEWGVRNRYARYIALRDRTSG
jgi:hypothetical protein